MPLYKCKYCPEVFKSFIARRVHFHKECDKRDYICEHCNKYADFDNRWKHLANKCPLFTTPRRKKGIKFYKQHDYDRLHKARADRAKNRTKNALRGKHRLSKF